MRETFRPSSERMAAARVTTRLEPVLASGMGGLAHPRSRSDPTAPDGAPRVPGGVCRGMGGPVAARGNDPLTGAA